MKVNWKNYALLFGCLCSFASLGAQKGDYIWLSGYGGYPTPIADTLVDSSTYFATSILDFNFSPRQIRMDSLQMYWDETNTSYCDSNGNLLFYTNGMYVSNGLDEQIEGSSGLNAGTFWNEWYPNGYRNPQGILAFQNPANANQYYFIHSYWDSPDGSYQYCTKALSSFLDMSMNMGHSKMIYTDHSIINDSLGWELAATQHANGRNWWVLTQRRNSNCFYRILIDEQGVHLMPDSECGGAFVDINDWGAISFSADGSKFAHFTRETGLTLYDFDRCAGDISNPVYIPNIYQDSMWYGTGVAFSPSGRFLYISNTKRMMQYDLLATDIAYSVATVGIYDGFYEPNIPVLQSFFNTAQIGPDGKIYISCGNSVSYYHVINNPDLKGDSCNFIQHGITLPSLSIGVPNFPNYRLGPLPGSVCDTLSGLTEVAWAAKEAILKVYPNPATTEVTIDYGFTDWSKAGAVSLELSNELGQVVYKQSLPQYSGYQKIDISKFAAGVYMAFIKRNEQVVAVQKFAKAP